MAATTLVDERIVEGDRLIGHMTRRGYPVLAAAWVKPPDDGEWVLYLVSDRVPVEGPLAAYRLIHEILRESPTTLPKMSVRMVGMNDTVAPAILGLRDEYPGWSPAWVRRSSLGLLPTEEVYVYPPAPPAPPPANVLGRRRLKRDARQQLRPTDLNDRYTPEEVQATHQLTTMGVNPDQARYLIWQRREKDRAGHTIPAGTIVTASYAAWWGKRPEDDPNPLLLVETDDGARGLTFLDNTEPVAATDSSTG